MRGGVVSRTVTVWLHWLEFPQLSVALQVRVALKAPPQKPLRLVTVLMTWMVTTLLQASMAAGGSKLQFEPHSAVLLARHEMEGGVVSRIVIVWLQVLA